VEKVRIRTCQKCGTKFTGRTDKKFCGDSCRNIYHNMLNKVQDKALKIINNKLKKNVVILDRLIAHGIKNTKMDLLRSQGFDFVFFTHELTAPDGKKYKYCYHYGYHIVNPDKIILISAKDPK